MDSQLIATLDSLLASSENLLKLAEEEAWEAFNEGTDAYIPAMQRVAAVDFTRLDEPARQQVAQKIEALMASDAVVMQRIRARQAELSKEMAGMRKSNVSAKAYRAV